MKTETLLIIPYLSTAAQGGELATAVMGWKKNFKGDIRIIVIGDCSPVANSLSQEGLIECYRHSCKATNPEIDQTHKMDIIIQLYSTKYDGCIWSNDDIYPVNPITIDDIRKVKYMGNNLKGDKSSTNWFQRAMFTTREALEEEELPIVNFSCHLPKWYNFNRMHRLIERYDCLHTPHLVESLYFNYYFRAMTPKMINLSKVNNVKCGVYDRDYNLNQVREAIERGVLFVNNSSTGYSPELIRIIREYIK